MLLKLDYSELSSALGYVNTIFSDKTVDERMKNAIFLVSKDSVKLVGYSALTFERSVLENADVSGIDGDWAFQVKAADLNKILGSFSSLFKTKVTSVEFSDYNNKIQVAVVEEAVEEKDAHLSQRSRFLLNNIPILDSVKKEIFMEFPEDNDTIFCDELLLYIDSLFPLVSNDSSSSLASKLNFASDYVFVLTSHLSVFFKNRLPESFQAVTLGYSSLNFLKKLCEGSESLSVQKIDRYLCLESGNTQAFLKYQRVNVKHEKYIKDMSKDNGIVIDRLYFKDVLKRMMISAQDAVASVTEDGLEVSNESFTQVIPLNKKKGDIASLKFKLPVLYISKAIVGDDRAFPEEIRIYFVKSGNGYKLFMCDSTGSWLSSLQVR